MITLRYVFRRLVLLIPVLLGVLTITFVLVRVIPGDPVLRAVTTFMTDEMIQELRARAGLDRPLYVQYGIYLYDLVRGDMGVSFRTSQPVTTDLKLFFPATFELTTFSMIIASALGMILGVSAALKRNTVVDYLAQLISVGGITVPIFWLGLLAIYIFFYKLRIAPPPLGRIEIFVAPPKHITGMYTLDALLTQNWEALASSAKYILLPVLTLGFPAVAPIARMARSEMIRELRSDYIRTVRSLGLSEIKVISYALRNSLLPVLTTIASYYGFLLGGSVLLEVIFAWPGLGQYAFRAIVANDYPAVQGYILLVTVLYVLIFLLTDIIYVMIDPRIRY